MAPQIPSRYDPLKKVRLSADSPSLEPVATATLAIQTTPPVTRKDASSTYARYIPPSRTKSTTSLLAGSNVESAVSKKRKRDEAELQFSGTTSRKAKKKEQRVDECETAGISPPAGETIQEQVDGNGNITEILGTAVQMSKNKIEKRRAQVERQDGIWDKPAKPIPVAEHAVDISKQQRGWMKETSKLDSLKEDDNTRHKSLMRKRAKSIRKAAKLAAKETRDSDSEVVPDRETEPPKMHDLVALPQPEPVPEIAPLPASASLPQWLASPIRISSTTRASFEEVGVEKEAAKKLRKQGLMEAFAIQAAVLPLLLPGPKQEDGDVLISAATGSGKTLAYILPMVDSLRRYKVSKLRGLIVLPTRELVTQARQVAETCSSAFMTSVDEKRVQIGTAVGNETMKAEQGLLMERIWQYNPEIYRERMRQSNSKWDRPETSEEFVIDDGEVAPYPDHVAQSSPKINILICTPGRLVEHLRATPGFTLVDIKWLVVDEADKLLDQSFQQWLNVTMADMSQSRVPHDRIRKIILSATMTKDVGQLSQLKLYRPKLLVLDGPAPTEDLQTHTIPSLLVESGVKVEDETIKPLYLMELLYREEIILMTPTRDISDSDTSPDSSESNGDCVDTPGSYEGTSLERPSSEGAPRGVLIFTKSNENAVRLSRLIALLSPSSSYLIGTLTSTLPRSSRLRTLRDFAVSKISILVASDLVSRGLDLQDLAHVVNYDIPTSLTNYVHRIGRTARAGKRGHAWTLFTRTEGRWFWNEIGRSDGVKRAGKVGRVNIKKDFFNEAQREAYGRALEKLGHEVVGTIETI